MTYIANGAPSPTATQTDSAVGAAFVSGLTPGPARIHASVPGVTFRDNNITTTQGALTLAEVTP